VLKSSEQGPVRDKYIIRRDFDDKGLIRLEILRIRADHLMHYEDLKFEGRDGRLYAIGPEEQCRAFH
jgi:hypothetical protein